MDLTALYYRIRAMSASEIAGRTVRMLTDSQRTRSIESEASRQISGVHLEDLLGSPLLAEPLPGQDRALWGAERILARAEGTLEGRITLYGMTVQLPLPVDWLENPFRSKKTAPQDSLPARSESYALSGLDIRSIWELNRLQFLVDLGRAFALTGESRFSFAVLEILESWQAANPYGRTVNWTNALEAGLRSISIILSLSLIREPLLQIEKVRLDRLARLLYLHGRYLEAHLSYPSSAFNHLAGEAAALAVLGAGLSRMPRAGLWYRTGRRVLNDCLTRLILEDGGPLEGSLHYLAFVCRLAVTASALCGRREEDLLGEPANQRLRSAYRFLCAVTGSGLALSEFGDSDRAYLPDPAPEDPAESYRSTLNLLALFPGRGLFLHHRRLDTDSAWLFGGVEAENLAGGGEMVASPLFERFDSSGRYVIRIPGKQTGMGKGSDAVFLRFECGHWGDGSIWAHAHADRLSFTLFLGGRPFFIDPGTGAYLADRRLREFFRSTSAHNTVTVDGRSQAKPRSCFLWGNPPGSSVSEGEESGGLVRLEGFHTGYTAAVRGRKKLIHRRRLTLCREEQRLEIEDLFETGGAHELALSFLLHPDCTVAGPDSANGAWLITNGPVGARLIIDRRCRTSLHKGEDRPLLGWYSPGFMRIAPCPQIVGRIRIEKEDSFVSVISWEEV